MRKAIGLIVLSVTLVSCSESGRTTAQPFSVATTEEQALKAMSSRYEIEAWEGYGLPGSPDAKVRLPEARKVLQRTIDECGLGEAVLIEATHGVVTLHVTNDSLSEDQLRCARSFEQPGLIFRDKKAG